MLPWGRANFPLILDNAAAAPTGLLGSAALLEVFAVLNRAKQSVAVPYDLAYLTGEAKVCW